ncbi:MAG TPA: sugar transferase [Conexibacter sp.]|jgi:lipopolysaccharide/colanic/teichoic acid biosynthesis glycosyltransferase|nr:sugar transferase [Conexibacter sp.]
MKRALDVAGALLGLLLSAPLLLAASVAIWLADRRPILFSHEREGRGGQPVRLWKLRTMVRDGDGLLAEHLERVPEARREWERYFRLAGDPRVLGRLGRALRRSSVDELPQLWNVLRGDMSLVGPRPLPPFVIAALPETFLQLRRSVRPGLTGLWQVSGRSDGDVDELVRLDTEYVRTASLALDLRILARTPAAVLSGAGAY